MPVATQRVCTPIHDALQSAKDTNFNIVAKITAVEAPRHVSNGVVRQIWVSSTDCAGQATQLDLWASCAERDTKVGELIGVFSARIAAYNGSPQKIRTFPGTAILFNDDLKTVVSQATYDLANDLDPDSIVGVADVQKRAPRRRVADREMLISYYVRHGGKSKKDATSKVDLLMGKYKVGEIKSSLKAKYGYSVREHSSDDF